MKSHITIMALAIAMAPVGSAGCDCRKDATAQQPPTTTNDVVGTLIKPTTATAKEVAATGSATAQEFINSAKGLVAQGKFQDALGKLKGIGGEKLSPNQQSMVDALKAQIETALRATLKTATAVRAAAGDSPKK